MYSYDESREKHLQRSYGLTIEQFEAMLAEQNHECAICHEHISGRRVHVDHNHATNEVRQILCARCNQLLGYAQESPERLRAAAAYLEKHTLVEA